MATAMATATARPRGHPVALESRLLDLTALALDLPGWDECELLMIASVARNLSAIYARANDPIICDFCRSGIRRLEEWTLGDRSENGQHEGILDGLRQVNGALDRTAA